MKIKKTKKDTKKLLFIGGLVLSVITANSIIYLAEPIESKIIYTNWILLVNSSVAAGLSVLLVTKFLKQKILNHHTKTHVALAIGLVLWLCANIQWFVYELDGVVPDVPSIADLFWIAAYPFLGYTLYSTFKQFYQKYQNKNVFFISIACSVLFIVYIVHITLSLSVLSSSRGIILFSIVVVYPILNVILIFPAIAMLIGVKKEPELSIPRMCESLALISLVIADSWFAVIFLSNIIVAIWYSNLLIVDHYIIISGGLLWTVAFLNPSRNKYSSKLKNWLNSGHRVPKITLPVSIIVLLLSVFFLNPFYHNIDSYSSNADSKTDNNSIKIGALLGLSGSSYESGIAQRAVLLKAVQDVNEYLSKSNMHKRIILQIENTEIKPEVAVAKVKKLFGEGVRIIIGPQTSSELKKIKEYADQHNLLLISQSSTAPSLSTKDNIFRLLQNDNNQGKKIAEKMRNDGVQMVVPIWRDDQYGNELYNITKANFQKLGGSFSNNGNATKYPPHVGEFAGSLHRINFITWDQKLKALNYAVSNAKNLFAQNYSKVGVYVISYGEIVPLLIQAPSHQDLNKVKWYGSEATAKNERLLKHQKAVEFANYTKFTSPLISMNETNEKFKSLEDCTHLKLNPNDANVYDALWIAALTENISQNMNFTNLKDNFYKIINSYQGATGNIKLDSDGDRIGNYDLWTIKENILGKNYAWKKISEKADFVHEIRDLERAKKTNLAELTSHCSPLRRT
jgi:branched-chain amino acid transport system substrate-binding protein